MAHKTKSVKSMFRFVLKISLSFRLALKISLSFRFERKQRFSMKMDEPDRFLTFGHAIGDIFIFLRFKIRDILPVSLEFKGVFYCKAIELY